MIILWPRLKSRGLLLRKRGLHKVVPDGGKPHKKRVTFQRLVDISEEKKYTQVKVREIFSLSFRGGSDL